MNGCLLFAAVLCCATGVAFATMGGQYSVNIHFVPPLVTGTCSVAQFWNPPNVTCALCFCMTGTLSRCIPQPGCLPNNVTNNATTVAPPTQSTMAPMGSAQMQNHQPGQDTQQVTGAPTQPPTAAPTQAPAAPTAAPQQPPQPAPQQPQPAPAGDPAAPPQQPPQPPARKIRRKRRSLLQGIF